MRAGLRIDVDTYRHTREGWLGVALAIGGVITINSQPAQAPELRSAP